MKKSENLARFIKKPGMQHVVTAFVALVVVSSVSYFGTQMRQGSKAATTTPGSIYMLPETGTYAPGSTVSVVVRENSGTDPVNSVQASMTYNASQMQFVSISEGTAFPTVAATSTATPGVIRVGRAAQGAPVAGDNAVVTVNFRVLATSGTTSLAFDPAFSFLVRSTDSANILTGNSGATFTVRLPAPTISAIAPASGPTAGGTTVTITGANFVSGATVRFGGVVASGIVFNSATSITATAPARAAGAVDVSVTNPDAQVVTRTLGYTYVAPAPTVSSITPATGVTSGGTGVTITGSNFASGATVTIGGTAAANVVFVSTTSLTAVTPARPAGAAAVVVTNPGGLVSTGAASFNYTIPVPVISTLTPVSGTIAGGTAITITGSNFAGITGVTLGGTPASSVVTVSPTTITAITPAHAAGLVNLVVTNTSGSGTRAGAYTYRAPQPNVTGVAPASGTANGGTTITIIGSNFQPGATVSLGGTPASNVSFVSDTTLTATTPAHASGLVSIVVANPDAQNATRANAFTYLALGDANNDGRVNAIDLSMLISNDGQNYPQADFDGDGVVGAADMAILLARWTW